MRVRIVFLLNNKGAYLPFHHQYMLVEMLEKVLSESGERFRGFADYTFSGLKGQTKVSKFGLHYYSSRVTLVLSCPNQDFVDNFLSNLFKCNEVQLGNLLITPESTEREYPVALEETLRCISISPIVIMNPAVNSLNAKRFIPPDTDTFSDMLYESIMSRMESSGLFTAEQMASFYKFQLIPDKEYLQKIKDSDKKFARIYPTFGDEGQKYEVRGYTFPFALHAAPEVRKFVFDCGLGALTHRGFGMLDLAQADLQRKTEPYLTHSIAQLVSVEQNGQSNGKYY